MNEETVHAIADQLRQYATHFAPSDWDYTRDLGSLQSLRYADGYDRKIRRLFRALRHLIPVPSKLEKQLGLGPRGIRERLIYFRVAIGRDKNLPDGVLDNGSIITHWEETGEYLQYVQPSVGALIADWLDAEPLNDYAQAVAAEMKRINDRYGEHLGNEAS